MEITPFSISSQELVGTADKMTAEYLFSSGRYSEAIQRYGDLLEQSRGKPFEDCLDFMYWIKESYYRMGEYRKAAALLTLRSYRCVTNPLWHLLIADCFLALHVTDCAVPHLFLAIELAEDDPDYTSIKQEAIGILDGLHISYSCKKSENEVFIGQGCACEVKIYNDMLASAVIDMFVCFAKSERLSSSFGQAYLIQEIRRQSREFDLAGFINWGCKILMLLPILYPEQASSFAEVAANIRSQQARAHQIEYSYDYAHHCADACYNTIDMVAEVICYLEDVALERNGYKYLDLQTELAILKQCQSRV